MMDGYVNAEDLIKALKTAYKEGFLDGVLKNTLTTRESFEDDREISWQISETGKVVENINQNEAKRKRV